MYTTQGTFINVIEHLNVGPVFGGSAKTKFETVAKTTIEAVDKNPPIEAVAGSIINNEIAAQIHEKKMKDAEQNYQQKINDMKTIHYNRLEASNKDYKNALKQHESDYIKFKSDLNAMRKQKMDKVSKPPVLKLQVPVSKPQCWIRFPNGCNKILSETKTPKEWFIDPDQNQVKANKCLSGRKDAFNAWCGVNDAQQIWSNSKPDTSIINNIGITIDNIKAGKKKSPGLQCSKNSECTTNNCDWPVQPCLATGMHGTKRCCKDVFTNVINTTTCVDNKVCW